MPLYQRYQERCRKQAMAFSVAVSNDEKFAKITTLSGLYKDNADFVVVLLMNLSGWSLADVTKCIKKSVDNGLHLLEYATQIPVDTKLPQELTVRAVMTEVLEKRATEMGDRLRKFKAAQGMMGDASLNWAKGVYTLHVQDAKILRIQHAGGDVADITSYGLTTDYNLQNNWSDFRAILERKPLPAVNLSKFFPKGQGPHSLMRFTPKNGALSEYVRLVHSEWQAKKDAITNSASSQTSIAARAVVKELLAEKRSEGLVAARAKAAQNAVNKRARTAVKLESNIVASA